MGVMRGHSRPKDGVLSHAYDPRIHEASQVISRKDFGFAPRHGCAGQARA
jgi:hypothetical protein